MSRENSGLGTVCQLSSNFWGVLRYHEGDAPKLDLDAFPDSFREFLEQSGANDSGSRVPLREQREVQHFLRVTEAA